MANPRKFSEKIALHNQKQAEETAAFEAILRDVGQATRGHIQSMHTQQLNIKQNTMQQYRGGSLPNVNQMVAANAGIDIQTLQHWDGMHSGQQSHFDRIHPRDRVRQQIGPLRSRPFQMEKSRAECSPYGSRAYLSPPPDTSWRRTNSDSAIHSSSLGGMSVDLPSPNTPPMHRRIHEVVGENSVLPPGTYPWDPKKVSNGNSYTSTIGTAPIIPDSQSLQLQQRPKSCEVPNINIYPSTEQDTQLHVPIANNTGSLPDLTMLQFPSPLTTSLDVEEQQQQYSHSQSNLSPIAHHMGPIQLHNGLPVHSPSSQRRRTNTNGPSPLVLQGNGINQAMHVPLSPPVSKPDPSRLHMDPRIRQQYMLYMQQQQQRGQHGIHRPAPISNQQGHWSSPTYSSHNMQGLNESPQVRLSHMGLVPKVCIASHENGQPEPSLTQYRNDMSDTNCQSPTSPHSQSSYSPSQSPGMSNSTWNSSMFELDPFHVQQQQQTNTLQNVQQQFEHFNMHQVSVGKDISVNSGLVGSSSSSMQYSQGNSQDICLSPDYSQQQFYFDNCTSQSHGNNSLHNMLNSTSCNNRIPDIILTGMNDGSFDTDFFNEVSDEALKDGLVPLDLDGLQMLTDPNIVTDADTENSFRLDQL